jgi:hypothetical protein
MRISHAARQARIQLSPGSNHAPNVDCATMAPFSVIILSFSSVRVAATWISVAVFGAGPPPMSWAIGCSAPAGIQTKSCVWPEITSFTPASARVGAQSSRQNRVPSKRLFGRRGCRNHNGMWQNMTRCGASRNHGSRRISFSQVACSRCIVSNAAIPPRSGFASGLSSPVSSTIAATGPLRNP